MSLKEIIKLEEVRGGIQLKINDIVDICHGIARESGWYTDLETGKPKERNFGEVVALMHSELSEALEAYRKDLNDSHLPHRNGIEVEFADCVIRIFDTAGAMGFDLGGAIAEKLLYNTNRADHKIENRTKEGGKKI